MELRGKALRRGKYTASKISLGREPDENISPGGQIWEESRVDVESPTRLKRSALQG